MKPIAALLGSALLVVTACGAGQDSVGQSADALRSRGETFFNKTTFDGNGRTCATCHPSEGGQSGTLSPADVQARYARNRHDPLFQGDAADVGNPHSFTRILADATIAVKIPLPKNVSIEGSSARSATFYRAIPTTMNTPAIDPVLMWDGRAPTLQAQAKSAIFSHMGSTDVSSNQLDAIAAYEKTLFNNKQLLAYARGGPEPVLPPGNTDSEKRGERFFDPNYPQHAFCGACHGGPLLNTTQLDDTAFDGVPPGSRFENAGVSDFNEANNPVYAFDFTNPDGSLTTVYSPDPGRALITGNPADANFFKIPTLWGIKNTAPYFHDNSAKTLEDMVEHYNNLFLYETNGAFFLSDQDKADIVAYLKLL